MADVDPGIEELAESLQQQLKVEVEGPKAADDDGYISSGSTENLAGDEDQEPGAGSDGQKNEIPVKMKELERKKTTERKKADEDDDDDDDDERILEPLVIIDEKALAELQQPGIEFISRGPVSFDQFDHRYQPYARPVEHHHQQQQPQQHHTNLELVGDEESYVAPRPLLLVYTKRDKENPTRLDNAPIEWSDKHELCIAKFPLPEDTIFDEGGPSCSQVQIFVQLNPNTRDTNTFLAHVKQGRDEATGAERHYIGPIVISLKRDLAFSMERLLLKEVTEEERLAAIDLVNKKEIGQLMAGIGPHRDTVLSILSAQRKSQNPGQTMAQIHAVIQRLINSPDEKVRATVFKRNLNDISPFEIAAITNNSLVAGYLAEVMYNLIDDTRTALKTLNAKDSQGNTIIHLLARKGDSNAATMQCLLDMRLTDATRVFSVGMNARRQTPLHIAAQSAQNQPETIRLLHQAMPRAFEIADADGMTPLHFSCQRTSDVAMVATILSYKKDNINQARRDGLTALDLITQRSSSSGQPDQQQQQIFPIDTASRAEIIKLLRNNGARSGLPEPLAIQTAVVVSNVGYCSGISAAAAANYGLGAELFDPAVSSSSSGGGGGGSGPNTPHSPQHSTGSPLGSPYSMNTSPCTISEGSPRPYYSGAQSSGRPGSVESYIQSSPESDHGEQDQYMVQNLNLRYNQGAGQHSPQSQASPYNYEEEQQHLTSYEEHIASQIIIEFPEIRNVLGQILDGNL